MVQSLSRRQAMLLGISILAAVVLSVYGLMVLGEGHWPWSKALTLQVGFQDVKGVSPGAHVRIKGNEAGQVREVRMPAAPDGDVVLVLRLDDRFRSLIRADAKARIVSDGMFGGKVIEIDPGSPAQPAIADGAEIASRPTRELSDAVEQVSDLASSLASEKSKLSDVVDNTNSLIKQMSGLASSLDSEKRKISDVVDNANSLIKQTSSAVGSFQQLAEGAKELPFLNSRVKDPSKILNPANCDRLSWWFKQTDLFEPRTDRLTEGGEAKLKDLAKKLSQMTKKDGAEVVVTAFADMQGKDGGTVEQLTTNQCLVVVEFLRKHKGVHKDWFVWEHKITPLGLGTERPNLDDSNMPAAAGLGVLLLTPRSL